MESQTDGDDCESRAAAGGNNETAEVQEKFNWKEHFRTLKKSGGNYEVSCNYCAGAPIAGVATRFMNHLLGRKGVRPCLQVPDDVRKQIKRIADQKEAKAAAKRARSDELNDLDRQSRLHALQTLSESLASGHSSVNKKWKQSTIEECDGAAQLQTAQIAIARMWYAAGLPFHMIAMSDVVNAFDAVCAYGAATGNQSVLLPTAPSLRNSRLDAEVARIELELKTLSASVESYGISLQSDGKDSMSRQHLVNIITTTPSGPQFREVVDVSGQSRDADHTAQVIVDAVSRLSQQEQSNLVTVITDTPSVNRKAWEILEKQLPHGHCVPCAAHCCNLHFKHVAKEIPEFNEMVEECKLVVRRCGMNMGLIAQFFSGCRFSNVDFARHMLRLATPKCTGRNLEVYKPGDTRFASNYRMIERLLVLRAAICQVSFCDDYTKKCAERKEPCPVQHLVGDKKFWDKLEEWQQLLEPVYCMLRDVDTHEPRLYMVYESALEIQEHYNKSVSEHAKKCGEQWAKDWQYFHVPIHSCAYVLHPRYHAGRGLER